MKKFMVLKLALVMVLTGRLRRRRQRSRKLREKEVFKIGVIQLVKHDALDSAYEGFVDELAEMGYVDGENIEIEYQNASNDQSNCLTIAESMVNDEKDLIFAIATPAARRRPARLKIFLFRFRSYRPCRLRTDRIQ
ncbi:MAG: ABC transporter substrate binding protein [Anaerovoracaceae bacterium]